MMRYPVATALLVCFVASAVPKSHAASTSVAKAVKSTLTNDATKNVRSPWWQSDFDVSIDEFPDPDVSWCSSAEAPTNDTDTTSQRPHLEGVKTYLLPSDANDGSFKSYPYVISPSSDDQKTLAFLSSFMEQNRGWINEKILQYGAVLFRGFDVVTAKDVERAVLSFEPDLSDVYRGTSPRHSQGGSRFVFSAAEVPVHYPIAQHCEMSFLKEVPPKLFFSALRVSSQPGGETALTDFRQVYRDLPDDLRQKLQMKKLRYTRTHTKDGISFTHDVAAMLSWPEMFRTDNKTRVEELSALEGMPVRWEGPNEDTFVSEFETEAFQLHPETGEPVWFNHIQVFHWTSFTAELFGAFRRTGDIRYLGRAVMIGIHSLIKYGMMGQRMALHVSFGDGEVISISEAHHIRKAVHQNTVYNRWLRGDIVAIDNLSTAHGRSPTYDSGRNVVVAWTALVPKRDAMAKMHLTADMV
ncbi:Taurine catabolism dioxygenase TauD, TfdA family [Seminavis robusta]|uniref:Taurine catabolism dioxygenase TauD, TfdA family n=1 Tax=Seminavis robusta TaxID=568900 RepID=A0A9N8H8A9_9STRA|nr:Taurine catabolism dioxygenase TauD, TfdA family [Seminavis robusta]|eukprot:Sro86_g045830.1 Taurine catabolism dioxygenase TauD, TfdA family (468) ;mRNA; r:95458-96958